MSMAGLPLAAYLPWLKSVMNGSGTADDPGGSGQPQVYNTDSPDTSMAPVPGSSQTNSTGVGMSNAPIVAPPRVVTSGNQNTRPSFLDPVFNKQNQDQIQSLVDASQGNPTSLDLGAADSDRVPYRYQPSQSGQTAQPPQDNGSLFRLPNETKGHALLRILTSSVQGAIAGGASNAQTYAQTGRNAGFGGGAEGAMTLPFLNAMRRLQIADTTSQINQRNATTNLINSESEMVPFQIPDPNMPGGVSTINLPKKVAGGPLGRMIMGLNRQQTTKPIFSNDGVPLAIQQGQNTYAIGDPNMPQELQPLSDGMVASHKQRLLEQQAQKNGTPFDADTLQGMNQTLSDRWQILNPGKSLPAQYTLKQGATQQDYARIDKALENVERAAGVKAQQDLVTQTRNQGQQDRNDKQGIVPVIGYDANGLQVFTNYANARNLGLTEIRQVGQSEAEKVTNARTLLPLFDNSDPNNPGILQTIDKLDQAGKLGPLASRWNDFLDGKYGKGDPVFEQLRTQMGLAQTGLMQVHTGARGSSALLEHFQDLVNEKKMDAGTMRAGIQTELGYLKGKALLPNGGIGSNSGMITVQIPGSPVGHIPASARAQFLSENPGAKVIQ